MIRTFFKQIWESIKNLKRNGWMTIAAISSVTITLILVGVFLSVIMNTSKLATDIENNVRVVAYTEVNVHDNAKQIADPNDKTKLIDNKDYQKVYNEIKGLKHVEKITFSSKEEELEKLTKDYGDTWELFKGDANPLYDAYIVEADSPENVKTLAKEIDKLNGIEKANYGGENSDRVFGLAKTVRTWGLGAAALLLLVAIFLISNTIRITIMSRSREIQVMRLVGAKNSYIRTPFFFEGAWVGLIGAIVPALLVRWAYKVAYTSINPSLIRSGLAMLRPATFVPQIMAVMAIIGILIGAFGSIMAMRRYLKY
jgi:cell division transport system permease protein